MAVAVEPFGEILGESSPMDGLREQARRIVRHAVRGRRVPTILILGETGTGKGLLARALHRASPRADGPFVLVNCAALPEALLEAELFGFEAGAFTDARRAKPGLFSTANGGTLFLDEVATLSLVLQAKLLTALEERVVRRLGSTKDEAVDVWTVAATSADLATAVRGRQFREDLYHRIAAITLRLAPLRERGQDVTRLAEHFLTRTCADYGLSAKTLAPSARAALARYTWPGNIRELGNVIERAALLGDGDIIAEQDLALPASPLVSDPLDEPETSSSAGQSDAGDAARLLTAYESAEGNLSRAASALRLPRNTLRYRLARLGALGGRPTARRRDPRVTSGATEPAPVNGEHRSLSELGVLFVAVSPVDGARASADTAGLLDVASAKATAFGGHVIRIDDHDMCMMFRPDGADDPIMLATHTALAIRRAIDLAQNEGVPRFFTKLALHVTPDLPDPDGATPAVDPAVLGVVRSLAGRCEPDAITLSPAAAEAIGPRFRLVVPDPDKAPSPNPAWSVPHSSIPGKPSVAVLPFRMLGGDPHDDYFGLGVTQDIVGALSRLQWLRVVSLGSTIKFHPDHADGSRAAQALGVRYVVTGTVRRAKDILRVTAELADASTGHAVLAESYDGSALDLFAFQDQIASCIAARLDSTVRMVEGRRALEKRPERLDAYDCVLRAYPLLYRLSDSEFDEAGRLLSRAIDLEPGFAAAHAWMALWFIIKIGQGSTAEQDFASARRYATTALQRDPDDSLALAISAHLAAFLDGALDRALTLFERSLALNPNSPFAWAHSGATFCYLGEPRTGLDRARYAMRLSPFDPLSFFFYLIAAMAELFAGNHEEAVAWALRGRASNPRFAATHRVLAAALVHLGRLGEARQAAQDCLAVEPTFSLARFGQRYPLRDRAVLTSFVDALRTAGLRD